MGGKRRGRRAGMRAAFCGIFARLATQLFDALTSICAPARSISMRSLYDTVALTPEAQVMHPWSPTSRTRPSMGGKRRGRRVGMRAAFCGICASLATQLFDPLTSVCAPARSISMRSPYDTVECDCVECDVNVAVGGRDEKRRRSRSHRTGIGRGSGPVEGEIVRTP